MMHYRKGENVEQELNKDDLPFKDCLPKTHNDFLWMHVRGGTKVNNVISYAKEALDKQQFRSVVWSGFGGGVGKTVSCAEILKRNYALHQVTRICYTTAEEHWLPQMDGLEEIVVNRQIPCIHILLSLDPIDESINGVQKPNTSTDFWTFEQKNNKSAEDKRKFRNSNNNHKNNRQERAGNNSRTQGNRQKTREQKQKQEDSTKKPQVTTTEAAAKQTQ